MDQLLVAFLQGGPCCFLSFPNHKDPTFDESKSGTFLIWIAHKATLGVESSLSGTSHPSGNIEVFLLVGQSSP
jgi:hypothetical protein